jgi:hypothetical protein
MENRLATFDLKAFARRGAEARIAELNAELAEIYRAFPDLRASSGGRGRAGSRQVMPNQGAALRDMGAITNAAFQTEEAPARRRKRRKMTAAERKAVGERMKKYWAGRRAQSAAKKR